MPSTALPSLDRLDPAGAWQPWAPDSSEPWGRKWAAHLYRRAAFGASATELAAAEKDGFHKTLDLVLNGAPGAAQRDVFLDRAGVSVARENNGFNLRGWWLYCMLQSLHPLREKMTLFWHNHFATSLAKVGRPRLMFEQNRLLRAQALGKFGPFLLAMSKDAAMLVWLDSNSNVKAHPNENYAREVMELFSLGVGNYAEKDVREAARAFTGWHTNGDQFEFEEIFHDAGPKTLLGQTGDWNGDDVLRILLKQPACARFLTRKLYRYFVGETHEPPDRLIEPLAEQLRARDYDVADVVRTILSSRHFYSAHAFQQRVKSPVEYALGAVRATCTGECPQRALVAKLDAMGQNLFAPPNVKGWPGGTSWLNTATLVARENFAQQLAMGTLWGNVVRPPESPEEAAEVEAIAAAEAAQATAANAKPAPAKGKPEEAPPIKHLDPARLTGEAKPATAEDVVRVLLDVYLPGGAREASRKRLVAFVADGKPAGAALDRRVRETVHAIMSLPEYQLA